MVDPDRLNFDAVGAFLREYREDAVTLDNMDRFIRYVDERAEELLRTPGVREVVARIDGGGPRPFVAESDLVTAAWLRQLNLDQAVERYREVFGSTPGPLTVDRTNTATKKLSRIRLIIAITEATTNLRYPRRDSLDGPLEEM